MTREEAIKYLRDRANNPDLMSSYEAINEACVMACEALKKQMSKEPNKVHRHKGGFVKRTIIDAIGEKHEGYSDERYADDILQCPVCKAFQYGNFCNYCDNCGQRLELFEVEE